MDAMVKKAKYTLNDTGLLGDDVEYSVLVRGCYRLGSYHGYHTPDTSADGPSFAAELIVFFFFWSLFMVADLHIFF